MTKQHFSVIIPVLNEASSLPESLRELFSNIDDPDEVEIIVCDGGSNDNTLNSLRDFPVRIVHSAAGRALQMNHAAQQAGGDWLVFLHSDTRLPPNWMRLINQCSSPWGHFDVQLSGKHWMFRVIESLMNLRSRRTSVATGDQTLFFRRDFFFRLNGYPLIPLMEDIAICKQARKLASPACITPPATTSSRRWEQNGILRTMILMWLLRLAYWLGVNPATLHRYYYVRG